MKTRSVQAKKRSSHNFERVHALHMAQADNEFPPQVVWKSKLSTPEVQMWTVVHQLSSHASTVYDYLLVLICCSKF